MTEGCEHCIYAPCEKTGYDAMYCMVRLLKLSLDTKDEPLENVAYWVEDRMRIGETDGHGEVGIGGHCVDPWKIPRVCSNCGEFPLRGGRGDSIAGYPYVLSRYCPHCGRRMLNVRDERK